MPNYLAVFIFFLLISLTAFSEQEIAVADFEGETYGHRTVTGNAFGSVPTQGTLSRHLDLTGFKGKPLVNTYYKGNTAITMLTSSEFVIECDYITLLIGGGGYEGKMCMNSLLDGKVVQAATTPNA